MVFGEWADASHEARINLNDYETWVDHNELHVYKKIGKMALSCSSNGFVEFDGWRIPGKGNLGGIEGFQRHDIDDWADLLIVVGRCVAERTSSKIRSDLLYQMMCGQRGLM